MQFAVVITLVLLPAREVATVPSAALSSIPSRAIVVGRAGALADTALGNVTVAWLSLDSMHGLRIKDLSLWLDDLSKNEPISDTDYDYDDDGMLTPADLPIRLEAYERCGWRAGATRYCA
jgi:hypothetical protein